MPTSVSPQGTDLENQSAATLLNIISKLRQELLQSRSETRKQTDNLNCLISLVKRAWYGEKTATLHLANIVGAPAQDVPDGGRFGNLGSGNNKTRAVSHWERLSIKLLQREYEAVQEEIQHRQMAYLENRNQYMEEVINSHHQDMSQYSLMKRSNSAGGPVENVDQTFLKTFTRSGRRPPNGKSMPRSKSAGLQRSRGKSRDILDRAEVTLRELVSQPNCNLPTNPAHEAMASLFDPDPDRQMVDERYITYDDSNRYAQSNLFDLDTVFGKDSFQRKARPMSAAFLKERDKVRSRPKSASTVNGETFLTQKGERPMKYETTRPVPNRGSVSSNGTKMRQRRHSGAERYGHPHHHHRESGSRRSSVSEIVLPPEDQRPDKAHPDPPQPDEVKEEVPQGPTPEQIAARERAAELRKKIEKATKRPECVVKFDQDLEQMQNMERQFRQTTLQLQKKLGIDDKGLLF